MFDLTLPGFAKNTEAEEITINIRGTTKTEMQLDGAVKILLHLRAVLKETSDFINADNIRTALREVGILILDKKDYSSYKIDNHAFSDLFTPTGKAR